MASAQDVRKIDETLASVSSSLASGLAFVGERGTGEAGGIMPSPAGVTSFGPPGTVAGTAAAAAAAAAKVTPEVTRPQAPASGVSGGHTSQLTRDVASRFGHSRFSTTQR